MTGISLVLQLTISFAWSFRVIYMFGLLVIWLRLLLSMRNDTFKRRLPAKERLTRYVIWLRSALDVGRI